MKKFNSLIVFLLVSFVVMAFCFPAWGAETIKIGVIGPMQFVQVSRSATRKWKSNWSRRIPMNS